MGNTHEDIDATYATFGAIKKRFSGVEDSRRGAPGTATSSSNSAANADMVAAAQATAGAGTGT